MNKLWADLDLLKNMANTNFSNVNIINDTEIHITLDPDKIDKSYEKVKEFLELNKPGLGNLWVVLKTETGLVIC